VEDVAAGIWLAAIRGGVGKRYVLGNREGNMDKWAFYALMRKVSGMPYPERKGIRSRIRGLLRRRDVPTGRAPVSLTANPTRAVEELGMPQTPLEQAFRRAVEWYGNAMSEVPK
jgi:dihydroflavonol-4-reductase